MLQLEAFAMDHFRRTCLLSFATVVFAAGHASAASFDCDAATTSIERAICADPTLSFKDEAVAAAYRELVQTDTSRDRLLEQRRWLAERNRCPDLDCLKRVYDARLAALAVADGGASADVAPDDPVAPGEAMDDPVASPQAVTPAAPEAAEVAPAEGQQEASATPPAASSDSPPESNSSAGVGLLIILFGGIAVIWGLIRSRQRQHRAAFAVVDRLLSEHGKALALRRRQLVHADPYGTLILKDWRREAAYFYDTIIHPRLTPKQHQIVGAHDPHDLIEARLAGLGIDLSLEPTFVGSDPVAFEHHCAEILRSVGWAARVTKGSGDQGSDVIAEKGGLKLILQCKLYSNPVGNKAVQEASAARVHEFAQFAACVTNSTYTPAAQALAATNRVALLHHDQLADWAEALSVAKGPDVGSNGAGVPLQ